MSFQQLQSSMLIVIVCLVLVITSAGNFNVSAAAQQYRANTLKDGCPNNNSTEDWRSFQQELLREVIATIETTSLFGRVDDHISLPMIAHQLHSVLEVLSTAEFVGGSEDTKLVIRTHFWDTFITLRHWKVLMFLV